MATRTLTIIERGLYKYAVCERCDNSFVSSHFEPDEANKEIHEKYALHLCKSDDDAAIARN
jgi:hypothetical protein